MPPSLPPIRQHPATYTRSRTLAQHASSPSATITQTATSTTPVLRLRATPQADDATDENDESGGSTQRRRVQWAENVVNNEGMGRKRSKVCCIYHRPRAAGESSDESSSSSSDSDSDSDDESDGGAKPSRDFGQGRGLGRKDDGEDEVEDGDGSHEHGECNHDHAHAKGSRSGKQKVRRKRERKPSPNAYERMPKNTSHASGSAEKSVAS